MKHLWVKTSTEVFEDGGKSIQYTCEDFPGVFVYSNAVYIPHTYDNGRWLYRSFAIETPLGFLAKEFRTLREAKAFVENGGFEDYEISKEEQHEEHDAAGDAARCGMGL